MRKPIVMCALATALCLAAGTAGAQCMDPGIGPSTLSHWTAPDGSITGVSRPVTTMRSGLIARESAGTWRSRLFEAAARTALASLPPAWGLEPWLVMPGALESRALRGARR